MKKIYKFSYNCGRMGKLSGIFVATDEEIGKAVGKSVYFGEVLGKHSEIVIDTIEKYLETVTDDSEFIKKFEELNCSCGYNPLNYMEEEE